MRLTAGAIREALKNAADEDDVFVSVDVSTGEDDFDHRAHSMEYYSCEKSEYHDGSVHEWRIFLIGELNFQTGDPS